MGLSKVTKNLVKPRWQDFFFFFFDLCLPALCGSVQSYMTLSFTSHSPTITHFCGALTYDGMLALKPQREEVCPGLEVYQSISSPPSSGHRSAVLTDGSVYHSAFGT